jgi:hypothetical protein
MSFSLDYDDGCSQAIPNALEVTRDSISTITAFQLEEEAEASARPETAHNNSTEAAGYHALEVFAGSKNLSLALVEHGIATDTVELKDGSAANDFTLPSTVASVISKIRGGRYDYVHLAPPCNTFSRARFPPLRFL